MAAFEFIDEILSRHQSGVPGNERWITANQRAKILELIGEHEESGALRGNAGGSLIWMPKGRRKFVLSDHNNCKRHKLTVLANLVESESGRLF